MTNIARYGVAPICKVMPIAPFTYGADAARQADRSKLPLPAKQDAELRTAIRRAWDENLQVYDVRKFWRQYEIWQRQLDRR